MVKKGRPGLKIRQNLPFILALTLDSPVLFQFFYNITMKTNIRQIIIFGLIAVLVLGGLFTQIPACKPDRPVSKVAEQPTKPAVPLAMAPAFNADSAYYFVKKQVDFGPRVPGTPAHKKCAAWLVSAFKRHGLTVIEQNFKAVAYFGTLDAVNIIAQYKPELSNRIIIASHWDSRHIADKDTKDRNNPILGADDGASGVGVLLELARMLQDSGVNVGVDLICFDAEDLGKETETSVVQTAAPNTEATWCLGSQYWAANLHKPGYRAQFGILLDMVGAKGAHFPYEGYSTANASGQQAAIWAVAKELGFEDMFPKRAGGYITDDHFFVMKGTGIPMVDIINIPNEKGFGAHHHTHADNMDIIDKATLKAVGQIVATMIYRAAKPI